MVAPIDTQRLLDVLEIDLQAGRLFWRPRGTPKFDNHYAGKEAGYRRADGYVQVRVDSVLYYRHRLIYAVASGLDMLVEVDHINGVPGDDRVVNLRHVEKNQQQKNLKLFRTNSSGRVGVCAGTRKAWQAGIWYLNKRYHLGEFDSFDEAVAAREAAERRFGYHQNHGSIR